MVFSTILQPIYGGTSSGLSSKHFNTILNMLYNCMNLLKDLINIGKT